MGLRVMLGGRVLAGRPLACLEWTHFVLAGCGVCIYAWACLTNHVCWLTVLLAAARVLRNAMPCCWWPPA